MTTNNQLKKLLVVLNSEKIVIDENPKNPYGNFLKEYSKQFPNNIEITINYFEKGGLLTVNKKNKNVLSKFIWDMEK